MKSRKKHIALRVLGFDHREKLSAKVLLMDILYAIMAGIVVGTAYYFFQNSNGFAPAVLAVWLRLHTIFSITASAGRF